MFLQFLGTGPAGAIPRAGHTDAACMDARKGGKSRRRRSAAFLISKETVLLIDAGPDILEQLQKARPQKIDAVLLTHVHADATAGLPLLDHWAGSMGFATKLPILTDAATARRLRVHYPHLDYLQFVPIKPFDRIQIGDQDILPFPVIHGDVPTYGYRFGKALAFASDANDLPARSRRALKHIPVLILDGAFFFFQKRLPSHLTTDETIEWGQRLGVKQLIVTQIGHTYPPHHKAVTAVRSYMNMHGMKTPAVRLAYDGLRVSITPRSLHRP
ncbi:MBL fold metallo-hydrolase [Patescibacteria group bacterium]|jgi:phosphoribosyl 1,2-cyclic phosphate phosphodiesterase|nr:MBL fold metallo-hydrolase [Patescibacteria group bacterium]